MSVHSGRIVATTLGSSGSHTHKPHCNQHLFDKGADLSAANYGDAADVGDENYDKRLCTGVDGGGVIVLMLCVVGDADVDVDVDHGARHDCTHDHNITLC